MADHRTASCSVLMMPEEHSNNSACSHKQQSLLCTTIFSLHLSAVPVSHSRASVLAVGPRAQIFPCPWNLFILCAVDFTSSIMLCYCCQWTTTAAHCLSSCFFLLSLLSHLLPCSNCWKPNREKQSNVVWTVFWCVYEICKPLSLCLYVSPSLEWLKPKQSEHVNVLWTLQRHCACNSAQHVYYNTSAVQMVFMGTPLTCVEAYLWSSTHRCLTAW